MAEPSEVHMAMMFLIKTFHKYSGIEGDKKHLSKGELTALLRTEMKELLPKANDKQALDKIFNDLDHNKDGHVDFQEFVTLVCSITCLIHEMFQES